MSKRDEVLKTLEDYHAAWARGDVDAGISYFAEDMIVHMGGGSKLSGEYRSRADFVTNWVKRVEDYTDSWTFHGNDLLMAGDDGVALMVHEQWTRGDRKVMCKRLGIYKIVDGEMPECWFTDVNAAEVDSFFDEID
ncbi:MAG: nuclear transport factor 2 family protein [Actinobacteria bacterium]|nr:nuclear transport factor 2 family protein [Actinomycetota bacterium]